VDLLIGTSVLVAIERRGVRPEVLFESLADRRAAIAAITVSELLHGVHRADTAVRRGQREHFVEEALAVFSVLAFDLETARVHGRLCRDTRLAIIEKRNDPGSQTLRSRSSARVPRRLHLGWLST
jgi:predicted nucleic acid-binding protein